MHTNTIQIAGAKDSITLLKCPEKRNISTDSVLTYSTAVSHKADGLFPASGRKCPKMYFLLLCLSETSKTILQGTVKEGRSQGRQKKGWEDNMREWTGLEFAKSQRAVENREK